MIANLLYLILIIKLNMIINGNKLLLMFNSSQLLIILSLILISIYLICCFFKIKYVCRNIL